MKKRLLSLFLAFVTLLGILPTAALAANTEEEALGEVDIYNGGYELSYLTINGRIRTQDYTYFNYVDAKGQKKEVPAYCVNPNIKGVPQTVGVGESIKYLANERWRTKSSVCSVRKSAKCDFFLNLMKKSLTFRLWQDLQEHPGLHRCPIGPLQSASDQGHHRPR